LIEIGLPFSDPLADGPTIQESSTQALTNGMTMKVLFQQLKNIRKNVKIPLLIMAYFNPILQFGVEKFCQKCAEIGIDGLIISSLPAAIIEQEYKTVFEQNNLKNIFLITPQTSEKRIKKTDDISDSFIYMVSRSNTTGNQNLFESDQKNHFKKIAKMKLKSPQIIGFDISNKATFSTAKSIKKEPLSEVHL
jgi:tryptophan synthase alpha chain